MSKSTARLMHELRIERDCRLADCDWTQLPDAQVTDLERAEWQAYRQALRDLPESCADLKAPVWPEAPA